MGGAEESQVMEEVRLFALRRARCAACAACNKTCGIAAALPHASCPPLLQQVQTSLRMQYVQEFYQVCASRARNADQAESQRSAANQSRSPAPWA